MFEERREKLGYKLLSFARQWMKFVMSKCERGRGTRPRFVRQKQLATTRIQGFLVGCCTTFEFNSNLNWENKIQHV